jgi:gold/copper resistance efflux pump
MLGVTLFGLVFTPVFYVLTRAVALRLERRRTAAPVPADVEAD